MASVTCIISKGDLPINISWILNKDQIDRLDGIDTENTKSRTSQLTIESVQAHHSGEYTCIAANSVGSDKFSSFLNVNGTYIEMSFFYLSCVFFLLMNNLFISNFFK